VGASAAPDPRIFCIPATAAPIVAVIRRGPTRWTHLGRWNLDSGVYEPGAWVAARVYPERCDVSPDGRWFAYFTLRGAVRDDWDAGTTYIAISRLPWFTALAAWSTCGTWTRGVHFVDDPSVWELGEPDEGDAAPCRQRFGMRVTAPLAFASEHRRGWTETDDSAARETRGMWDENIDGLTMRKPRPHAPVPVDLTARGYYAAFRSKHPAHDFDFHYDLHSGTGHEELHDVQWADWDRSGQLLVATTDGRLQIRVGDPGAMEVAHEVDLSQFQPDPQPPPAEAGHW
jgi:hypothetical protein